MSIEYRSYTPGLDRSILRAIYNAITLRAVVSPSCDTGANEDISLDRYKHDKYNKHEFDKRKKQKNIT